jgi:hypothetical protein
MLSIEDGEEIALFYTIDLSNTISELADWNGASVEHEITYYDFDGDTTAYAFDVIKNDEYKGQLPEDSYLSDVEVLYLKTINTSTGQDIVEKEEPVLVEVSYNRQINGVPVVGPGDFITVSLGDDGEIIYFFKTWRELEIAGEVSIIDANTAIKNLQEGKTIQKPAGSERPIVEINDIKIGYFSDVTGSNQDFYKPVWIFKGIDDRGYEVVKCVDGVAK